VGGVEPSDLDYCYVTTTGRRTGSPHTIEIWFALHEDTVYADDLEEWGRTALPVAIELPSAREGD
jgi:hypothetical protein